MRIKHQNTKKEETHIQGKLWAASAILGVKKGLPARHDKALKKAPKYKANGYFRYMISERAGESMLYSGPQIPLPLWT